MANSVHQWTKWMDYMNIINELPPYIAMHQFGWEPPFSREQLLDALDFIDAHLDDHCIGMLDLLETLDEWEFEKMAYEIRYDEWNI